MHLLLRASQMLTLVLLLSINWSNITTKYIKNDTGIDSFMFRPVQIPSWQSWKETRWVYGKCVSSELLFVGQKLRPKGNNYSLRRRTSEECWEKHLPLFAFRSWQSKSSQQVILFISLMLIYFDILRSYCGSGIKTHFCWSNYNCTILNRVWNILSLSPFWIHF